MLWNWKYRGKEYKGNQRNDRWTIGKRRSNNQRTDGGYERGQKMVFKS